MIFWKSSKVVPPFSFESLDRRIPPTGITETTQLITISWRFRYPSFPLEFSDEEKDRRAMEGTSDDICEITGPWNQSARVQLQIIDCYRYLKLCFKYVHVGKGKAEGVFGFIYLLTCWEVPFSIGTSGTSQQDVLLCSSRALLAISRICCSASLAFFSEMKIPNCIFGWKRTCIQKQ